MTIDAESAVSQLQQLLEQQTLLTHEQAEANRLERERLTQEQRKLDLEAQRLDFDRQRDNRALGFGSGGKYESGQATGDNG